MKLGKTYRNSLGGSPMTVVGFDDRGMALVKRADQPKKNLATPRGGYPVAKSEWHEWKEVTA